MRPAPDASCARARRSALLTGSWLLSFLCFAPASFAEGPGAGANVPLPAPPIVEAAEVSVTAARGERSVLDVAAHVTVIDREEIEASGAANLPELLRRQAGISVANTTTNVEGYNVEARGFLNGGGNGCRTLVLVDGRRVNEPDTGCPDWTFLSLANIERVEVIRGAASAAYGDNALGGVIEISTRGAAASEDGSARGALHAESSSFDSESADAFAARDFGAFGGSLAVRYDDTAGYRDHADLAGHALDAGLDVEVGERGSARLSGGFATSDRSRPGALFEPQASDNRTAASGTRDSGVEREQHVQAALALALPAELALRAVPYYRHSQADNDFVTPFFSFPSERDLDMQGIDLQLRRDLSVAGMALRAIGGGELRRDEIEVASGTGSFASANDAERDVFALFVQLEAALADDLLLSVGLRRDDTELTGSSQTAFASSDFDTELAAWSPRASLAWRFREDASAWLSYARGFRFPNLDEAFGAFGFSPGLEPERSQAAEIGAR
jgi:iron complex outermembrane receptor protein